MLKPCLVFGCSGLAIDHGRCPRHAVERARGRPCLEPTCTELGTYRGRCATHARIDDQPRGSAWRRGYGKQWQTIRSAVLARAPLCARCGGPATDVHHLVAKRDGGSDRPDNLLSLCHRCHSSLTGRGK